MSGGEGLQLDVRVRRGEFALHAALEVAPGEIVGVIGPNGSGKSTLLGTIAGTLPLDGGFVRVGGRDLSRVGSGSRAVSLPRAARRVGLLDQRARLFPHMNAAENVAFGPRAQGMPRAQADALVADWLARVGLEGRGEAREGELSGGEQQRIAIARTLAAGPEALLLDEPFAAIDVESAKELRGLIAAEIGRLGVAAILVTHSPEDIVRLASRVVVLEAGAIAQAGEAAEVFADPATEFAGEFAWRASWRGLTPDAPGGFETP